jgi:ABC-type bacteriocin/lantibiotic exporter with double-glycine peptidase domain
MRDNDYGDRPDATAAAPQHDSEVEAASWLIEQLEIESGLGADRSRIRRALDEAMRSWPGPPGDRWWRWLMEASDSLGLRCRVIDCTFDQICEISREGGRVLLRSSKDGRWQAVAQARGRKFRMLQPHNSDSGRWIPARRLRDRLGAANPAQPLRCIVIEPRLHGALAEEEELEEMTPLRRAWALLRPESQDIWIVLLFGLVTGVLALATPLAIEALVSTVTFGRMLQPIVVLALMLLVFLSFQAGIRALQTFVVEIIQRRLFARISADLAWRFPRVRYEALDGHSGRELVNRFFEVVTVQKVTAQLLLDGIMVAINTLVGMIVLGLYHPWLLGFDVVLLALIAFAVFVLGRGAVATAIKESKTKYHMAAWLEDLAAGTIAFRSDGAPEFALERTDRLTHEYLEARRKHFRVLMRQILFALGLQAIASTVLLGMGGWLVVAGQLTLGQLVAAELIVTVIVTSFAKMGKHLEAFYDLMASVDKLGMLIDLPLERHDGVLRSLAGRPAEVQLRKVHCRFLDGRPALQGVSLKIHSGDRAALTGRSGSGKSILLELLFGLRTSESGMVAINGINPRDLRPDVLRRSVVLAREIEVFDGTLAENVHLERPDVSTADVRDALREVGLLDESLALKDGLETRLASTGHPFTPNQLRKLMLARAIVGRPTLLLIDGLIDSLSDRDAAVITETLFAPNRPWTVIVVSGRREIVDRCSRVLSLHEFSAEANLQPVAEDTAHAAG